MRFFPGTKGTLTAFFYCVIALTLEGGGTKIVTLQKVNLSKKGPELQRKTNVNRVKWEVRIGRWKLQATKKKSSLSHVSAVYHQVTPLALATRFGRE